MQDYPPFAKRGSRERKPHGYEPHDNHDAGPVLWITAALAVAGLSLILAFSQDNLKNGGAPFLIVPPSHVNIQTTGNS